ncbi:MAG: hypothetical protein IT225_01985 [Flavobacteriales bacterium]|jgi:hypothetical protein|nr:hypothetical protein [Flavobacteriales bacterium]
MRSALFLSGSLLLACHAYAQNTKEGYALLWSNSIAVVPDSLVNGKHKLPAFTITVFESDGNKALDLWRAEYKPMSQAISGSKPVIATGVVQPAIATTPLTILASSSSDKKLGIGRLTLAFGKNDSVPADEQQAAEKAMYDMAVKYNKAIVQEQITTKEKSLGKATSKEESAQASAAKLDKKSAKASNDLKKIKAKQGKIQANNAKLSGEIAGLEKKFQMTNDPKDLAKLAKMRSKLTGGESDLAKLMSSEAKLQGSLNKIEGSKPDAAKEEALRAQTRQEVEKELEQLRRKLNDIR